MPTRWQDCCSNFPKLHEKLDYQNFTFEILEMDERRISKVKVVVHDHEM